MKDTNITEVRDKLLQNFMFIKKPGKSTYCFNIYSLIHIGISPR